MASPLPFSTIRDDRIRPSSRSQERSIIQNSYQGARRSLASVTERPSVPPPSSSHVESAHSPTSGESVAAPGSAGRAMSVLGSAVPPGAYDASEGAALSVKSEPVDPPVPPPTTSSPEASSSSSPSSQKRARQDEEDARAPKRQNTGTGPAADGSVAAGAGPRPTSSARTSRPHPRNRSSRNHASRPDIAAPSTSLDVFARAAFQPPAPMAAHGRVQAHAAPPPLPIARVPTEAVAHSRSHAQSYAQGWVHAHAAQAQARAQAQAQAHAQLRAQAYAGAQAQAWAYPHARGAVSSQDHTSDTAQASHPITSDLAARATPDRAYPDHPYWPAPPYSIHVPNAPAPSAAPSAAHGHASQIPVRAPLPHTSGAPLPAYLHPHPHSRDAPDRVSIYADIASGGGVARVLLGTLPLPRGFPPPPASGTAGTAGPRRWTALVVHML